MGDIDFTWAGWVYLDSINVAQQVLGKFTSSTAQKDAEYALLVLGDNKIYLQVGNGTVGDLVGSASALSINTWYYVVAWHDSVANTLNIQVNNSTISSVSYSGGGYDGTGDFSMGTRRTGAASDIPFNGRIDEVGFWRRILTSDERTTLYGSGNGITYPFIVDSVYTVSVDSSVAITPNCSGLAGTVTYTSSDATFWNSSTHTWSYSPIFEDGGTVKNLTFSCTNGVTTLTATTKVITFRSFSNLQKYPENPISPYNTGSYNSAGSDTTYIKEGQSVNGTYYSITQGSDSGFTWKNFILWTSTNLKTWTPYSTNPVFTGASGQWDATYLVHPSIINIDNTWYMYYSSSQYKIGLATSTDFITWTRHPSNPIYTRGSYSPSVIKIGNLYYMYYWDENTHGNLMEYATSSDGITWTYGGVALSRSVDDWDYSVVSFGFDPWIIQNHYGYYEMMYSVNVDGAPVPNQQLGYAVSSDGITWYKYQGTILTGSGIVGSWDRSYVGDPSPLQFENYLYLYYVGCDPSNVCQGGLGWIQSTTTGAYKNIDTTFYADSTATYSASPNGFTNANLVATPSAGTATVTVTTYNLSAGNNNTLIAFNANSTNGNNVTFTINGLSANTVYSINNDGALLTNATSNGSGQVTFSNSSWSSQHTFTIYHDTTTPTVPGVPSTTSSNANSSSTFSSVCTDTAPGAKAPWLYGAIAQNAKSILLYFTQSDAPVNKYVLEYGTKSGEYPYGVQDMGINTRGQMTFLVKSLSPNTTYYFRIRGGNGCAAGAWSNELSAKTKGSTSFNQLDITQSTLEPIPEEITTTSCQPYTVKSGDTLWSIAKNILHDASRYNEIIETNKSTYPSLTTSTNLRLGWELQINCKKSNSPSNEPMLEQGYDVKVKVVDTNKKPVVGAKVTMHSKVQEAVTNKDGVAQFTNVESGNHKVIIAYNNFEGEQSIDLTGNVKAFDLNITVQQKSGVLSPLAYGIIGILVLIVIVLLTLLMKRKRNK